MEFGTLEGSWKNECCSGIDFEWRKIQIENSRIECLYYVYRIRHKMFAK